MARTLKFNRVHKNGWLSWKLAGVPGAVFVDGRMLSAEAKANPQAELTLDIEGMVEPGVGATEAQAAKLAKQQEREAAKAAKATAAAEKAKAKLVKLQEQSDKAAARAKAAAEKAGVAAGEPVGAAQ